VRSATENKLAVLVSGIQKHGSQKSTRRLEDAIANLHALERQSAVMHTQSSLRQQRSPLPRPYQQDEDLRSMRQRMAEMEKRARERTQLRTMQSVGVSEGVPPGAGETAGEQSRQMQVAKKAMLLALTDGTASSDDLAAAVTTLTKAVTEAGGVGVAEATVMIGAAQTRLRQLQLANAQ
jgi:hypothetical protein